MSSEKLPSLGLGQRLLAAAHDDASWVVCLRDDAQKTLSTEEIVDAYNERLIDPETYVWADGMRAWEQLQAVDELVDALHASAAEHPQDASDTDPALAPVVSDASGAPAANDDGYDWANHGTLQQNDSAPNENSAMFSLAMLVSDNERPDSKRAEDDSGLIDLAALTASAPQSTGGAIALAPTPHEPLFEQGLFPLGAAVPAATTIETELPSASPKNRGIVVGLMAAVGLLAAMLVFQVAKTSAPDSTAQPTVVGASTNDTGEVAVNRPTPTAPTATPVAPDVVAPPVQPAVSASATAVKAPAPSVKVASRPRPTSTAKPKTPRPKPTAKPPAKSGSCNCKPSELQCQMRCSVKKQ